MTTTRPPFPTYAPPAAAMPAGPDVAAALRIAAASGHVAALCWPSGHTELATPWGLIPIRREEGGR